MIVADAGERVRFVTQPEHAALAGRFAERWGNDEFDGPEPEAVVAAYTHDDGWFEYDRRPHLDEDGDPIDFTELPEATWIDLYDDGIDGVVELDPYAGLLVSMHGTGLRRRRYGLSPSWPDTPPAFREFVEREEDRQERLVAELLEDDRVSGADAELLSSLHRTGEASERTASRLWFDYRLLQAWDTLSLAFCTTTSPPGYDEIGGVPIGVGSREESLTIEPLGDRQYRVEPYPFDESPLQASVPARTLRRDDVDGEDDLVGAYYGSEREAVEFAFRRSG